MENQLHTIKNFLRFFDVEDCLSIGNPTTMEDIKNILKMFAKDKSPGPDGWTV